jgi:hypothetical protein
MMVSPTLLAQALPSASSGVDWLYQFTNNLTNLTTQNGGALTQLGLTELSAIALFTLISMVINWNTSGMTLRFHTHPVRAGDLTHFLLRLIVCCLLINYWVNPLPGASFGLNHFFSYIAQAMVAAFDQSSLDNLLQLLKTAGDNTSMPSLTAPVQILCYFFVQALLGLASAILFLINCSSFILYGVTALFGPVFIPLLMTRTFRGKFFHFLDVLLRLRHDSRRGRRLHLCLGWLPEHLYPANLQRNLLDGDVAGESDSMHDGLHCLHHQLALYPQHDPGDLWRDSRDGRQCSQSRRSSGFDSHDGGMRS